MCGIAGVYFFDTEAKGEFIKTYVNKLLFSIRHRGPDNDGAVYYHSFGMGMRRLSIIDLEKGHQPMFASEGRYSIVFNGEIYNFQSLRKELQYEGLEFKSLSDTEVVLLGYVQHGASFIHKLEGMFAFAIYDSLKHELFMARDRLGKKPLYYHLNKEFIVFSSEVRSLIETSGFVSSVDEQSYWDYLTYRYIPGENTSIRNVNKFPNGHQSVVSSRGMKVEKYWDIPTVPSEFKMDNLQEKFGSLFSKSVKKRLVANVPVGVVLSGGIDSCAVLYEASKYQKINSYHVCFGGGNGDYNELKYATLMAKHANSKLNTVTISENEFIDTVARMASITDEPLSDLSAVPLKFVCDLAIKDVKVVLSGEGSDEVLAGYDVHNTYFKLLIAKILQSNACLHSCASILGKAFPGKYGKINKYLHFPVNSWARRNNFNITFQINQESKLSLRNGNPYDTLDSARILCERYKMLESEDFLNQMLQVISRDWLIEDVLMKSDKVSMSSSLEVRCPFLDHHLVEFLFRIPGRHKVGFLNGKFNSKVILKRYLHGRIPAEIINRKKLGFPVPAYAMDTVKTRDFVFDTLKRPDAYYDRVFDRDKLFSLFDVALKDEPGKETPLKHFFWSVVVFEQWYQNNRKYLQ